MYWQYLTRDLVLTIFSNSNATIRHEHGGRAMRIGPKNEGGEGLGFGLIGFDVVRLRVSPISGVVSLSISQYGDDCSTSDGSRGADVHCLCL